MRSAAQGVTRVRPWEQTPRCAGTTPAEPHLSPGCHNAGEQGVQAALEEWHSCHPECMEGKKGHLLGPVGCWSICSKVAAGCPVLSPAEGSEEAGRAERGDDDGGIRWGEDGCCV